MNDEIKIEKSVPIPGGSESARNKYPLASMEVGDSFEVLIVDRQGLASAATVFKKKSGHEFTTRQNAERTKVRIWRIK